MKLNDKNVSLPWIILGDLTGDTGHLLSILGEMFRNAFLGLEHSNFNGDILTGDAFLGGFTLRILALFLPFILIVTFISLAMLRLACCHYLLWNKLAGKNESSEQKIRELCWRRPELKVDRKKNFSSSAVARSQITWSLKLC